MPSGPFGGPRPLSNSVLKLVISEVPVPSDRDVGSLPEYVNGVKTIKNVPGEDDVEQDIADTTRMSKSRIDADWEFSKIMGMGERKTLTIRMDVSDMGINMLEDLVSKLEENGYEFSEHKFE